MSTEVRGQKKPGLPLKAKDLDEDLNVQELDARDDGENLGNEAKDDAENEVADKTENGADERADKAANLDKEVEDLGLDGGDNNLEKVDDRTEDEL